MKMPQSLEKRRSAHKTCAETGNSIVQFVTLKNSARLAAEIRDPVRGADG
jgi:hypothetical protein